MSSLDNQIRKAPFFNEKFEIWMVRMMNLLIAQDFEFWESVDRGITLEEKDSNEHNAIVIKSILNGLPNPIKV